MTVNGRNGEKEIVMQKLIVKGGRKETNEKEKRKIQIELCSETKNKTKEKKLTPYIEILSEPFWKIKKNFIF